MSEMPGSGIVSRTGGSVKVVPATGAIGAEIQGVDLANLDAVNFDVVERAFYEYGMLVFREQSITEQGELAFARRWGEVVVTPMLTYLDQHPGVLEVVNRGKAKTPTEYWHYDSAYLECPPALSILAARTLPPVGGDTMWCNQYLAYESLSDGMKRLLSGVRGKFCGTLMAKRTGHVGDVPYTYHPIVRRHLATGRSALFLSHPETVPELENMTPRESRPLLDYLYGHSSSPDRTYRHHWRTGDVVMWDNRCTMHYAVHDYGDHPRVMHRVTIAGERPEG